MIVEVELAGGLTACPHGFVEVGGTPVRSCYVFGDQEMTQAQANSVCTSRQAKLITLESSPENEALKTYMNSNPGPFHLYRVF